MDFTKEISGKMSDNEEDSAEDHMMKVEALKAEKRKLKGAITRQLNEFASRVAGVWKRLRKKLSKYWKNHGHCIRN